MTIKGIKHSASTLLIRNAAENNDAVMTMNPLRLLSNFTRSNIQGGRTLKYTSIKLMLY